MDIYCTKCGEPWDMDSIHDEIDWRHEARTLSALTEDSNSEAYVEQYRKVRDEFYSKGCAALAHGQATDWCVPKTPKGDRLMRSEAMSALVEIMGDDVDGIASMMDDYYYLMD